MKAGGIPTQGNLTKDTAMWVCDLKCNPEPVRLPAVNVILPILISSNPIFLQARSLWKSGMIFRWVRPTPIAYVRCTATLSFKQIKDLKNT
jgi:hypothetical protein